FRVQQLALAVASAGRAGVTDFQRGVHGRSIATDMGV
ncbi:hypothetical protein PSYPI_46110, partial [Pseudomonas syringae pv. pisi str. 1704B]